LASEAIFAAWQHGITHWDTADVYGNGRAERLIGQQWSRVPRRDIFLASKVGWEPGEYSYFYNPKQMRRQIEKSLRNLQTDVIDLYYFHHCDFGPKGEQFDDALDTMHRFREEGKYRFLGLSDWDSEKIMKFIDRVDPDAVQPYRNVIDDPWQSSGLKEAVAKRDIGVAFFSPLRQGLVLGKYDEPKEFPEGDVRRNIKAFRDPATLARMKKAADALRARFKGHPEPVLHGVLGALLADAPTGTVLLGQRNVKQVEAAARVGEALSQSDAEWVKQVYAE
ncbi:MAG TPA: aldo/keto reductase, partial [Thermoanaerobaculia bacterium]|nr:aldo/keto reductase [Thermoanaerobaculia bacterium]